MKKLLSLLLVSVMALGTVACSSSESASSGAEIALVTDVGTIDDKSFNQGSWEGVVKYATEVDKTYNYYQPAEKSDDAIMAGIELAIKGGAKAVVCPGYLFNNPIFVMQEKYPDINFVFVDGAPQETSSSDVYVASNTASIFFAEQQAGFLAGYAAVLDGYRNLGFMGGIALPAVVNFGYGFVQGAEYAGKELGLGASELNLTYTYVGDFDASPEHVTKASAWYSEGVEVIFACGGGVGNSVMKAAETSGAKVIGVDVDQSVESETVITSAMKNLQMSIYDTLKDIDNGTFQGGESIILGAESGNVLLPMETSKFETFTQAQYDAIYTKIVNNEFPILNYLDVSNVSELSTSIVNLKEV